jgi:tryptophan-rich sensory protein
MKSVRALTSILIAQMAGVIGSVFTANSINNWYDTLNHPGWGPPNWVFGPVWVVLYTIIGYSAFLIWEKRKVDVRAKLALWVYGIHLVLNALWSVVFFGMQNPQLAFFEILVLGASIALMAVLFVRISRMAGLLMLPYIGWVFFATYLNYTIWMLN